MSRPGHLRPGRAVWPGGEAGRAAGGGEPAQRSGEPARPPAEPPACPGDSVQPAGRPATHTDAAAPHPPVPNSGQGTSVQAEESRLAELGRMASGLAHEIRNPLNALLLNTQLLEEDLVRLDLLPGQKAALLELVAANMAELRRLDTILTEFLRYARPPRLELAPTDLGRLVAEVLDFVAADLEARGIRIVRQDGEAGSSLPIVATVDAGQLKQALLNIVYNAVQAMPAGGTLAASVRRRSDTGAGGPLRQEEIAEIEIADTGVGIPESERPRLFTLFYSTKPGGTGLGLPLVKRVVEAHGGTVDLTSEVGRGTTVRLRLPLAYPMQDA